MIRRWESASQDSIPVEIVPETDAPDIELTDKTEEDGLPAQGNILTADTLTIPLMSVNFYAETDFTNVSFDPETDQAELISDEVDINTPGTYSTIYRITHSGGEKMGMSFAPFWFWKAPAQGNLRWPARRIAKIMPVTKQKETKKKRTRLRRRKPL